MIVSPVSERRGTGWCGVGPDCDDVGGYGGDPPPSRTERGPEVLSVVLTRQRIERAMWRDCGDAIDSVTHQDASVAGWVEEMGRARVVREQIRTRVDGERRCGELTIAGVSPLCCR